MPRPRKNDDPISPAALKMIELRKSKGWTQTELAEKLGTHLRNLARIETGRYRPSLEIVEQLMKIFDLSADAIMNPSRKPTAKEVELSALMADIAKLDEKQRYSVRILVDAHKRKMFARVHISDKPVDNSPGIAPEDAR